MKISTFLTVALSVICFIAIGKFAVDLASAYRNYNTVQQLRALVEVRGELFEALTKLSTERSVSQVLLASPRGGNSEIRKLRKDQITVADEYLAKVTANLAALDSFPMREELIDDMKESLSRIADYRLQIEDLTGQLIEERDMAKVAAVITAFKAEITEMKGYGVHFIVSNSLSASDGVLLARLQEKAFDAREYAGRARSHYAVATLNGSLLTPAEREYAYTSRQRALETWAEVHQISETVTPPASILAQIDLVDSAFKNGLAEVMKMLDGEMDAFAAASPVAETVTYSLTFGDFFASSTIVLNDMTNLSKITGEALDQIWQDQAAATRTVLFMDLGALIALIALALFALRAVANKVSKRLESGLKDLAALTSNDLNREITHKKGDLTEVAQLTDGLIHLQSQLRSAASAREELADTERTQQKVVQQLSEGLNNLAAGDLSVRINEKFDAKYQELADNFNAATAALSDLVSRVIDTSSNILSGARGINSATVELSQRTETQGVTLQNAAAALEQLTRNIISSQTDATELDQLARLASDKGGAMTETMAQTVSAIESIKNSSQQIEQIVSVIEDIAFQTNLLALNAGVEATRAGVEGSGFAVIASEVRGLAERSAQSAQDIKALIAASGVEVAKGVDYVAEAENSVGDIGEHIKMISTLISRIAMAAAEQSQGLSKVNDGVSQLDLVTQTNVAMVEETTAECASLSSVAQDLSQLVSRFHIGQTKGDDFGRHALVA